jgi:large subunit ribosomal protein L21
MSIAIIKTGGKQYIVGPGQKLKVEKLTAQESGNVSFDTLLTADPNGTNLALGQPTLKTKVSGKIIEHGRAKKINVIKYKAKTRYRRQRGHRQSYTQVAIEKI